MSDTFNDVIKNLESIPMDILFKIFCTAISAHKSEILSNNFMSTPMEIIFKIFYYVMNNGNSFINLRSTCHFFQTVINKMYEQVDIDLLTSFKLNLISFTHTIQMSPDDSVKIMDDTYACGSFWYKKPAKLQIKNVNHCNNKSYCKKMDSTVDGIKWHSYQFMNETLNMFEPITSNCEILLITDDYIIYSECLRVFIYEIETTKKVGEIDYYVLPASGFQVTHKNYLISFNQPSLSDTSGLSIYDAKTCEKIFLKNCQGVKNYSFYYPYLAIGFVNYWSKFFIEVYDVSQKLPKPVYVHEVPREKYYDQPTIPCEFSVHGDVLCVQMYGGMVHFVDIIKKCILISYKTKYIGGKIFLNNNSMFVVYDGYLHIYHLGCDVGIK